ncbi:hypothetical protein C8R44DRAFT_740657 [Mycena epipterygia]|nr:hypothetical protein C8R44DRAFT_740657 [Mycena epipterygia]
MRIKVNGGTKLGDGLTGPPTICLADHTARNQKAVAGDWVQVNKFRVGPILSSGVVDNEEITPRTGRENGVNHSTVEEGWIISRKLEEEPHLSDSKPRKGGTISSIRLISLVTRRDGATRGASHDAFEEVEPIQRLGNELRAMLPQEYFVGDGPVRMAPPSSLARTFEENIFARGYTTFACQ